MSPPFGKELLFRLTIYSLCFTNVYDCGCFPFKFRMQDFDSNANSYWSLLNGYFE